MGAAKPNTARGHLKLVNNIIPVAVIARNVPPTKALAESIFFDNQALNPLPNAYPPTRVKRTNPKNSTLTPIF